MQEPPSTLRGLRCWPGARPVPTYLSRDSNGSLEGPRASLGPSRGSWELLWPLCQCPLASGGGGLPLLLGSVRRSWGVPVALRGDLPVFSLEVERWKEEPPRWMNGELAAGRGWRAGSGRRSGLAPPPDSRGGLLLCGAHSPMAPDPSSGRGHHGLLLLACCLSAAQADLFSWIWPRNSAWPIAAPASKPPGSSPVWPTEDTTTHVAPRDAPTDWWKVSASPTAPLGRPEVGQGQSPTGPTASTVSLDPKEENIAGVGAKILNVAQGIRSFVQLWDNAKDTTPAESSARAGTLAPETPTDPLSTAPGEGSTRAETPPPTDTMDALSTPGPSITPQDSGTTLQLSTTALSSPDTQRTEAGTLPVPTQLPPSPGRPWFRESLVSPTPGRFSLSSVPARAPPRGSQLPLGRPLQLDGEGLLLAAARPGQQHADDRRPTPPLPPLVTGSLGRHTALWALSSDPPAKLSHVAVSALTVDSGAWAPHVANSAGPRLANKSTLLGAAELAATEQPVPTTAGRCLPLPPSLALCGHLGIRRSWWPNHLHHTSREEVQAAVPAWGALLRTHCHRFLAWFFCLLLAPPCGPGLPPGLPPCRQFCEALEDACWSRLDGRGLPLPCASLPAREDGHCVFIGPPAGNGPPATCFPIGPARRAQPGLHEPGSGAPLALMSCPREAGRGLLSRRRRRSGEA